MARLGRGFRRWAGKNYCRVLGPQLLILESFLWIDLNRRQERIRTDVENKKRQRRVIICSRSHSRLQSQGSLPRLEACEERGSHNAKTSLPPCRQRKSVRPRNNSFSIIILPMTGCDRLWHSHQRNIVVDFPQAQIGHLSSWLGCITSPLSFVHANMTKHEDIKARNIGNKTTNLTWHILAVLNIFRP